MLALHFRLYPWIVVFVRVLNAISVVRGIQQPFSYASESSALLSPAIDAFVDQVLAEWNSPGGVAIAVVRRGANGEWTAETKGYGTAKADGTSISPDSLFCIASNSKLFTAIAAGLVVSNKSLSAPLSWDTRISDILPEWGLMDPISSAETTIKDAMSHRTGQPRHDLMYGMNDTTSGIIGRLRYLRPSTPHRYTWQYCNNMYTTLSHLQPTLLNVPFVHYVAEHIFKPLHLTDTTYSYAVAKDSGHLAQGFARDGLNLSVDPFGKGTPRALEYAGHQLADEDGSFKAGAGGVIMNVRDAAKWLQTLLLEGKDPLTGAQVIPPEVITTVGSGITVAQSTPAYPELSSVVYGGGQQRYSYRGYELIEHGGATKGFFTQITRFPHDDFGIAVFSNDDTYGGHIHDVIKWRIIDEFFGLKPINWSERLKEAIRRNHDKRQNDVKTPPAHPEPPSVPIHELAGTYSNPAYGQIEFCFPREPHTSPSCTNMLSDVDTVLPGVINGPTPQLLTRWNKFWSTHLVLTHFDNNVFNGSAVDSRPILEAENGSWVAVVGEGITAEFAFASGACTGLGLTGVWGAGPGVTAGPSGTTVEEKSEVWFERL